MSINLKYVAWENSLKLTRAQGKRNAKLEIYKAFQDRLTFLNRHMIVKIRWIFSICQIYSEYRIAGHLLF